MCLRPRASARVPTLGWKPVIAIGWANAAHFYSLCSIFSYAGFLAVDCGWAADADTAGFVAGLLPTAVLCGRLFTSILWGHAADRCGRRPSMIASMVAVTLGNVCFGLTTSLPAALAVRFLLIGALNGWVTLMGLCVLECAGEAMQPVVWSYVFATGSVVALLGPAIGGWTYAALGPRFPALPPSLVGGAIGATAVAVNVAWLPETKPRATSSSASAATASSSAIRSSAIRAASSAAAASSSTLRAASTSSSAAAASSSYSSREGPAGKANKADAGGGARTRLATHPGGGGEGGGEGSGGGDNGGGDNGGGGSGGAADGAARPPLSAVLCSHPLPLVMVLRAAHGCALFAAFDLVPLWGMASRYAGGLALTEEQLGTSLAAGAVVQVVFTSLAMGRLVRRLGLHASLTAGCTAAALLTLCLLASPSATAERWWLRALGASLVYGLQTSAMLLAGTALVSMSNLPRALEAEHLPISPHLSPDLVPPAPRPPRTPLSSAPFLCSRISPYLPISIHPQSPVLVAPSAHALLCTHGTRGWCPRPEAGVSSS